MVLAEAEGRRVLRHAAGLVWTGLEVEGCPTCCWSVGRQRSKRSAGAMDASM